MKSAGIPPKGFTFCVVEKKHAGYVMKFTNIGKIHVRAKPSDRYLMSGMPCVSLGLNSSGTHVNAVDSDGEERVFNKRRFSFIYK